jgi:hypothetical protein
VKDNRFFRFRFRFRFRMMKTASFLRPACFFRKWVNLPASSAEAGFEP